MANLVKSVYCKCCKLAYFNSSPNRVFSKTLRGERLSANLYIININKFSVALSNKTVVQLIKENGCTFLFLTKTLPLYLDPNSARQLCFVHVVSIPLFRMFTVGKAGNLL